MADPVFAMVTTGDLLFALKMGNPFYMEFYQKLASVLNMYEKFFKNSFRTF